MLGPPPAARSPVPTTADDDDAGQQQQQTIERKARLRPKARKANQGQKNGNKTCPGPSGSRNSDRGYQAKKLSPHH
jgi:hypothetical protein